MVWQAAGVCRLPIRHEAGCLRIFFCIDRNIPWEVGWRLPVGASGWLRRPCPALGYPPSTRGLASLRSLPFPFPTDSLSMQLVIEGRTSVRNSAARLHERNWQTRSPRNAREPRPTAWVSISCAPFAQRPLLQGFHERFWGIQRGGFMPTRARGGTPCSSSLRRLLPQASVRKK
jgi:hypothetical protein